MLQDQKGTLFGLIEEEQRLPPLLLLNRLYSLHSSVGSHWTVFLWLVCREDGRAHFHTDPSSDFQID